MGQKQQQQINFPGPLQDDENAGISSSRARRGQHLFAFVKAIVNSMENHALSRTQISPLSLHRSIAQAIQETFSLLIQNAACERNILFVCLWFYVNRKFATLRLALFVGNSGGETIINQSEAQKLLLFPFLLLFSIFPFKFAIVGWRRKCQEDSTKLRSFLMEKWRRFFVFCCFYNKFPLCSTTMMTEMMWMMLLVVGKFSCRCTQFRHG